jgi:hypothetical protein
MEKNYITRGVGYVALLAAVVEQTKEDAKKARKRGNMAEVVDCERGIAQWAAEVESNLNFKIYE